MQKRWKIALVITVIWAMILSPVQLSFADEVSEKEKKVQDSIVLGRVTLKDGVTAEVKDLIALPSKGNQNISFTVTIHNKSNSDFNFIDYWVELYTKSGSKLSIQLDGENDNKVPAQTSKDLVFYSKASSNVKVTDLKIKLIKWVFSAANYVNVLGEITVPQRYNPVTPADSGKVISIANTESVFSIERATVGKSEKYYRTEIRLNVKNSGKTTLTLPDVQLFILTRDNFMYPVSTANMKDIKIDPLDEKKFTLTASIPISVKQENWKIALMYSTNEGKDFVPVAAFEMPKTVTDTPGDSQREYTFSTSEGIYHAKLESLNRLPLEDNDLVVANMTVSNPSDETLPMPDLTGSFTFNDKVERDATVSQNDRVIALLPGESTSLQIAGTIPYTFEINKVNLLLQQKQSEGNDTLDLVEFSNIGTFSPIPRLSSNQGFEVKDIGYRSDVKVKSRMTFLGRTGKIIAAQLTVTNKEKRLAEMQQLAGYFEKDDGTVYPATFQYIKDKLTPGGTAMIYAQAIIPANEDLENVRLVVGKALSEKVQTGNNENPETIVTGYVSPYSIELPAERAVQENLQLVDVEPYQLSINRIRTQIDYEASLIKMDLDYTLDQDLLTKADLENHKIIFELKDNNKGATFYAEYPISTDPNPSSIDSTKLYPGKHKLVITPWQDPDLLLNIQTLKDYSFSIYVEIQPGYKKLIATEKSIPWMVDRILSQ